MVTLKDIAAEAGVSITTVSNVVHNRKSRVSEKKVAKIWEIIEREHYVPSMSARSLANDQSAIIAMVTYITPRTTGSTVSDPFMSSVAASVEQRTREAGYYLMLRSAESVAALEGLIHSWRLSGLIMTGLFQDSFFDAVAKLGIPVVLIDSYVDDPEHLLRRLGGRKRRLPRHEAPAGERPPRDCVRVAADFPRGRY